MLPTGTVTLLFTDIEGSTARWEAYGGAMDEAIARHDATVRSAMHAHGGHVFKTVGDAFCVVFTRASDAVAAAADVQRALASQDFSAVDGIRIRCAVHTGETVERDGDYFGPALSRVARLMSIGHGGQILLSAIAGKLAAESLPPGTSLAELGPQLLEDLAEPEHVWQLTVAGLTEAFAPLRSIDARPNNLPLQQTSFVGRERDVAQVKDLIEHYQLVTLLGAGGVGKTRLALQVGSQILDCYPDGVWFVDFAALTDPELVSSVVAKVLGMRQEPGRRIDESLPIWLKRKKLLLILDNCEHLVATVATLANAVLSAAKDVALLATSRQSLDLRSEMVYRLPSLSVPAQTAPLRAGDALQYGAVGLFVDRARATGAGFVLSDETVSVVAEICRRLDGIPLAIELAAARVKVLSVATIAQRLDERFKVLTGGSRDTIPRQKTLSALIGWSFDLLTQSEQIVFSRLGVFAGGFGIEAAAAVCSGDGVEAYEIIDLVASLSDKSLVVADTTGREERYRMLESIGAYAVEKLDAAGRRDALARRHAEYFRDLALASEATYGSGSTYAWLASVERELPNYRAALEWSLTARNDAAIGGAICGALRQLWVGGLHVEGRYWLNLALDRVNAADEPHVAAQLWHATSTLASGKPSLEAAQRAVDLYRSAGDSLSEARVMSGRMSTAFYQMGRLDEAVLAGVTALQALGERKDELVSGNVYLHAAAVAWAHGDVEGGRKLYGQALENFRSLQNEIGTAMVLGNMAEMEFADGHPETALRFATEALELHSRGKYATNIGTDQSNIAAYRIALGDVAGARESARSALRLSRQTHTVLYMAIAIQHLALVSALEGNTSRAATLLGYVDAQYALLEGEREPTERWVHGKLTTALRAAHPEEALRALAEQGALWSEEQAVNEALEA